MPDGTDLFWLDSSRRTCAVGVALPLSEISMIGIAFPESSRAEVPSKALS